MVSIGLYLSFNHVVTTDLINLKCCTKLAYIYLGGK